MLIGHIYDNKTQTLQEHLENVKNISCSFANSCYLDVSHMSQIALYHDIGKSSDEFQRYIKNETDTRISHSNYGGYLLSKKDKMGAFCVFGHHSGLTDWGTNVDESTTFLGRCNATKKDNLHYHIDEISVPEIKAFAPQKLRKNKKTAGFDAALEIRMYMSCLVDADWQDSAGFIKTYNTDSWGTIYNRFFEKTETEFKKSNKKASTEKEKQINQWRTEIFNDCRLAGKNGNASMYSLSAPTGAGKTFASMAFALERVKQGKANRIIYCIPYTSIIEQNADVYESVLGSNNIVENHSLTEYIGKENFGSEEEYRRWVVENWDSPIILSTNVQFFESLLSHKPGRLRKLHNIANSVIILDEAQMLPREFLTPCKEALKLLVEQYGCTVVLCTATQPCLEIGENGNEILSNAGLMYERFKRVSAENLEGIMSGEELTDKIVDDLEKDNSVLCVVNRRKTARILYNLVKEKFHGKVYHLSLNMCAKHREEVLNEIKKEIKSEPICVISTSLIEAGVDLSFNVGYRELTGLDRLVQAAGRVNRNGRDTMGTLKVFRLSGMKYVRPEERESDNLLNSGIDIFSQEAISRYFRSVYSYMAEDDFDKKEILKKSKELNLREIGNINFIEDNNIPVVVPYDEEAKKLIDKMSYGFLSKEEFRRLRKYTVDVPFLVLEEMIQYNSLVETKDNIYALSSLTNWYANDYGLESI